ncbi:MAG: protein kinase family protein, partial [Clostridiales bacterium]|nr:protein kinase family protein [Clostridiales bacterium]
MPELIKNPHAVTREYWVDYASPIYKGVSCNVYPVEWMEWMGEWPSRICAKVVPLGGSSMSRFRFDNASSIASSLDSKYLLKPLDCFMAKVKSENFGFLISERFDIDLRDFLDDVSAGKRIARPDTLKDIFRDILLGISALNKAGLIHRDIKAANVLLRLTSSGTYKSCAIADFGIVKDVAKTMTPPGAILGTLFESAPPEAFLDSRISSSYDLFGAGMIWYRMFNADDANYAEEYALPARQQLSPMEMLEIASSASRGANATSEEIDREYLKIFYNRVKDGEDTFPKLHHCSCPYSNRTSVPPDIGAQDFLRKLLAFSPEDRFESPGKALAALG